MTKILILVALTLSLVLPLLSQFEGEIDMKTSSSLGETKRDQTIVLLIKKDKIAITVQGEGGMAQGRVVFREDKEMMWVIDDKKKTVMEIPTKTIEDMGAKPAEGAEREKVKFRKLAKTETILGYHCESWLVEKELETKEVYGTSKLGDIYDGFIKSLKRLKGGRMESMMNDFEAEMMRQKIFPLKSITTRDGNVTSTEEVTKIQSRSVPASTFEIPSGYKKQSMDAEMSDAMKRPCGGNDQVSENRKDDARDAENDGGADASEG
jgi:hypothetical protein